MRDLVVRYFYILISIIEVVATLKLYFRDRVKGRPSLDRTGATLKLDRTSASIV